MVGQAEIWGPRVKMQWGIQYVSLQQCISITNEDYLGCIVSFWDIVGVLGNWARLCPFDVSCSAKDSVFRAEHEI